MKRHLTIVFGFLSVLTFGQSVDLKWKIGENEKLNYLTVMSDLDTSKIDMNFGDFFNSFSDSNEKELADPQNFLNELNKEMQSIDYISTLTNKGNDIIDIITTARPKDKPKEASKATSDSREKELMQFMQVFSQSVMIRGSIYATGGIHSFWVKSNQKNIISAFFELPTKPVKIGDKWQLDIDFISNDQNFACDSSYRINEVTLIDLKKSKGETIAVIKYNIVEYVSGSFIAPGFISGGGELETMMKFSHQAIAEFSIDKGRWKSYDGVMSQESTGLMRTSKKTKFALIAE